MPGAADKGMQRRALMLNNEVAAVITAMRQNAKWAVVSGKYNVRPRWVQALTAS
jgi:hypothetical protein